MDLAEILTGKVRQFEHGWGFIEAEDQEFFVHFSNISYCGSNGGFKILKPEWKVQFKWHVSLKGFKALDVVLIEESNETPPKPTYLRERKEHPRVHNWPA